MPLTFATPAVSRPLTHTVTDWLIGHHNYLRALIDICIIVKFKHVSTAFFEALVTFAYSIKVSL